MKGRIPIILTLILLLFRLPLGAQEGWDGALDRYERICDECIRLRNLAAAGRSISSNDLSSLLSALATLRGQLRAAEGNMTPAQQERFRQIRQRYAAAFSGNAREALTLPALSRFADPVRLAAPSPPLSRPAPAVRLPAPQDTYVYETPSPAETMHITVAAFCGIPDIAPGAMLTIRKNRLGGYLKASATIDQQRAAGTCRSDGTTGTGTLWTTGRTKATSVGVSAGLLWQALPAVGLYAGAGYASRQALWEEASGRWLQVTDLSGRGPAADLGLLISIGRLSLLAGGSALFSSPLPARPVSADLGLAWTF